MGSLRRLKQHSAVGSRSSLNSRSERNWIWIGSGSPSGGRELWPVIKFRMFGSVASVVDPIIQRLPWLGYHC